MKAVILWLSMNTSKVVNRSFSLLYFAAFVIRRLISDIDTFTLALLLLDRPEILSNQSFVYESRRSLARREYLQGGQQQFSLLYFSVFIIRR